METKRTNKKAETPTKLFTRAAAQPTTKPKSVARHKVVKRATVPKKAAATRTPQNGHATREGLLHEAIALRAYFIGKNRSDAGYPGDPQDDWLEAERQILT
jgi:hypothetical protein